MSKKRSVGHSNRALIAFGTIGYEAYRRVILARQGLAAPSQSSAAAQATTLATVRPGR